MDTDYDWEKKEFMEIEIQNLECLEHSYNIVF